MLKVTAAMVLCVLSPGALAHEDRILPIGPDGTLGVLPSTFGPVKVLIDRSPSNSRSISRVELTSPRFTVKLSPCVTAKLSSIAHVETSGSWYHNLSNYPAYVSLTFFSSGYAPTRDRNSFYSVTFSLADGHILSAERAWDPWWGAWRAERIQPADQCNGWRKASLGPYSPLEPKPPRGLA